MRLKLFIAAFFAFAASAAFAEGYFIRLGPASVGNGGSNPYGIPPGASDLEAALVTNNGFEANLGIPGLLFGHRFKKNWGGYVSLGGGLVLNANGVGPGVYSAFGYDFGWRVLKFNFEYKQAIGIGQIGVLNPSAVRFGIGLWNN